MNVPSKFKKSQVLDKYQLHWLAVEMRNRLCDQEWSLARTARMMNVRPAQVLAVAREYPRTFRVTERRNTHYVSLAI